MDRLSSMTVFVKAVETGSFAAAASALDLSAPMIGKHIRFLEDRLGITLLNRTTRRQSLTDFGSAYYERCRAILAEVDEAEALALEHQAEPRGKLKITMPILYGRYCVAPVLLELAERYPALELDLSFDDHFVDLVGDGYDLAIRSVATTSGNMDDRSGLMSRLIARHSMIVCASPTYLERNGAPKNLEDIGNHGGIIYSRSGRVRPWAFPRNNQPPAEVKPVNRVRMNDLESMADAASAGFGLAWLPSWLVRERIRSGSLVEVLPGVSGLVYENYALWLSTSRLNQKVRVAIDALAVALPRLEDK